jgi:hypothetical protein
LGLFGVVLVLSYGWLGAFVVLFYGSFSIVLVSGLFSCSFSFWCFFKFVQTVASLNRGCYGRAKAHHRLVMSTTLKKNYQRVIVAGHRN